MSEQTIFIILWVIFISVISEIVSEYKDTKENLVKGSCWKSKLDPEDLVIIKEIKENFILVSTKNNRLIKIKSSEFLSNYNKLN